MNFEYFIARKVAASGQRSFSLLIIRIAVVAVALSVAVMIVSTALIAGFKKEISSKIFGFWGHIHITDANVNRSLLDLYPISTKQPFYPSLDTVGPVEYMSEEVWFGREVTRVRRTLGGVRHIQPFCIKPGIIEAGAEIEGIILKGVDASFDWVFVQQYLQEGRPLNTADTLDNGILISRQTADRLQLVTGDDFLVHFLERNEEITRKFKVQGIYKTGLEEYDQKFALVDMRHIQQLLGWKADEASGFEVFIDDIADLQPLADHIYYDKLPNGVYAETIREKFPEIFDWLELQNINEAVILLLMLIVAIINMITALLILILERTNMIGVLKSMGSSNWSIRKIFLYYAAYIIAYGLFWGNLIGIGLCLAQRHFHLIKLSEADYYLSVAPVYLDWWTILVLNVGTLVINLLFLILPSYLVTRISPVKAIRFK